MNELQKQFKEEKSKWLEKFFIEEEEKKLAQKKHDEIQKLFCEKISVFFKLLIKYVVAKFINFCADESQIMLLQHENELKDYQEKLDHSEKAKNDVCNHLLWKIRIYEI